MKRDLMNIGSEYPEAISKSDEENISSCLQEYKEKGFLTPGRMYFFHSTWKRIYENYWEHVKGKKQMKRISLSIPSLPAESKTFT